MKTLKDKVRDYRNRINFRGRRNMKRSTRKLLRLRAKDVFDIKNSDKLGREV